MEEINDYLADINVAIPATIISYSASNMRATVKPSIPKRLSNGETLPAPQIVNVPVCFPVADGGKAMITLPIKPNDGVLLVFSHRSIENWLSGSSDSPDDPRMFDLSDAFAMPSVNAKSPSADPENLCVMYGAGTIKIASSGDITINAPSTHIIAPENTIDGNLSVTGKIECDSSISAKGDMTAQGEVSAKGKKLSTHKHTGVQGGNGITGGPE